MPLRADPAPPQWAAVLDVNWQESVYQPSSVLPWVSVPVSTYSVPELFVAVVVEVNLKVVVDGDCVDATATLAGTRPSAVAPTAPMSRDRRRIMRSSPLVSLFRRCPDCTAARRRATPSPEVNSAFIAKCKRVGSLRCPTCQRT